MTLTDQFNRLMLTAVPRNVEGKGRSATIFDSYWVTLSAFLAARDTGAPLSGERVLQDGEVAAMKRAVEQNRPFQAPAGIPGYDLIDLRGDRLIHFSRPVCRLVSVTFIWHPPVKLGVTADSEPILTAGHWVQRVDLRLIKCQTPKHEVKRLVTEATARESRTPTSRLHHA